MASGSEWNLKPTILGPWLRLDPYTPDMAEEFIKVTDPECFTYFTVKPKSHSIEDLIPFFEAREPGGIHLMVARRIDSLEPVAFSSYLSVSEENKMVEVGFTVIAKPWRGTWVNPEMKRMMLEYAFEVLGVRRLQLKGDARNARSRAAMLKIGAQFEGVLRSHMLLADGTWRDTAFYSILDEEWPQVKTLLGDMASERRLRAV